MFAFDAGRGDKGRRADLSKFKGQQNSDVLLGWSRQPVYGFRRRTFGAAPPFRHQCDNVHQPAPLGHPFLNPFDMP